MRRTGVISSTNTVVFPDRYGSFQGVSRGAIIVNNIYAVQNLDLVRCLRKFPIVSDKGAVQENKKHNSIQ